jgi:hypothetical protein
MNVAARISFAGVLLISINVSIRTVVEWISVHALGVIGSMMTLARFPAGRILLPMPAMENDQIMAPFRPSGVLEAAGGGNMKWLPYPGDVLEQRA